MGKIKIIKRKECLVLTWPAKLILLSFLLILAFVFITRISIFLSPNKPFNNGILVLDGQMPDYSIVEAIKTFDSLNYEMVVTTGGNLPLGYYISDIKTMAEVTKATFIELGFDSTKIVAISTGNVTKNRTYSSAMALKKWLDNQDTKNKNIDIFAIGCHARRSKLLFSRVLEENYKVGVICVEDNTYNSEKWWDTSKGARTVISETVAFIYSYIFLKP